MALIWGEGGPVVGHACRDTIDKNFGPFCVGPWLRRGGVGRQGEKVWEGDADMGGS